MKVFDNSWRTFAVRTVVFCVAAFGTIRLAVARPGVAGGPARSSVTVAGTLSGVTGTAMARFRFYDARMGGTMLCESSVSVLGGPFSVEVPLEGTGTTGPRCLTMFDGADVFAEVAVDGMPVGERSAVNPVPYAHFASVAGQYSTPDCPLGYLRVNEAGMPAAQRVCVRRRTDGTDFDVVVRVGTGQTAFWIDRFEATIWRDETGTRGYLDSPTVAFGTTGANFPTDFPANGQWLGTSPPAFALSRALSPTRYVTWFRAEAACRASGKRLPTGQEWLAAARTGGDRTTGAVSDWGVRDMLGNLSEWTADWFASVGQPTMTAMASGSRVPGIRVNSQVVAWPSGYDSDNSSNIAGVASAPPGEDSPIPAAATRGGSTRDGDGAGVFSIDLRSSPVNQEDYIGFRCVIPR